ncbi:hypothetical protein GF336_03840 [Candidatus Woesearchaeota archaeon]|nr:hypothetical protein [Candidatus Woesearchaeota archaeon]
MSDAWKNRVIDILKENTNGLTISELKDLAGTTRHTVSIALAELKGEGKISIRKIGMAKLHYLDDIKDDNAKV